MGDDACKWCESICYNQSTINGTGDCDLLGRKLWFEAFPYATFPVVLLGFFGHVIVGITVWKFFRSNRSLNLLLGLFFPDIASTVYECINKFYQIITKQRYFYGESPGCTFEGYLLTMLCILNVGTSELVAYERYRTICHSREKQDDAVVLLGMYAYRWIAAFIIAVVAAQLGFVLTYSKAYCMTNFKVPGNVILGVFIIAYFLSFTCYYYWCIYSELKTMEASNYRGFNMPRFVKLEKVANGFMKLFFFMAFCWTPYFIYIFVIVSNIVPLHESALWDVMAHFCVTLNASANPYLALWLFPSLREKAKQLFIKSSKPPPASIVLPTYS